jgi:carbon monoxide dehydrogenase subunit G
MNLTGEYRLAAPREAVWRALNDPDILRRSIPGCESVDKLSDTELTAKVTLAIGPMKARFSGKVTLADLDPPQPGKESAGYTIAGEGQGGVAGFGKGKANVTLDAATDEQGGAATVLRYQAEAQVGGKIAQLGARLIDATAKKLADEFFGRFAAIINAPAPSAGTGAATAPMTAPPGALEDTTGSPAVASAPAGGLKPIVWVPLLIAVVAILLWWFARS